MNGEVLALAAGLVGLFTVLAKWGRARWVNANAVEKAILAEAEIADALVAVRAGSGGCRAAVIEAHNGTAIPRIGDKLTSTARWESCGNGVPSLCATWRGVSLDAEALKLLRRIVVSRSVKVRLSDMEPGALRDTYGAHGVAQGLSIALASRMSWWRALLWPARRWHWFWLCVDWPTELDLTDAQRDAVRTAADRIRLILYGGRS